MGYTGPQQTALIVDDNAHNRLVLISLLEPLGFVIVEAENGQDAVLMAQKCAPQVIIMDAIMPLLTGMEATRQIRLLPELQNVLIVAVSAGAYEATQADCMAAGADAFLPKPFKVDDLLEILEAHLPLQWLYDDVSCDETQVMILPNETILSELYNLAVIGDFFGIQGTVDALAQETSGLLPFVHHLRGLIDEFDDEGTIDFLKSVWLERTVSL